MTRRHARAALLCGSALLIGKLFALGEMARYMSPALDPLTALAGLVLAGMGLAELRGPPDRGDAGAHHDGSEQMLTYLLLLLPLALGFLIVPKALGSSSLGGDVADLLLTFGPTSASPAEATARPSARPIPPAPASPIEDVPGLLAYLQQAGDLGIGQRVGVVGLVARGSTLGPDELVLLRYSIAHCVADARPLGLLVVGDGDRWPTDQWIHVEGTLESREREGDRLVTIVAETIAPSEEPANPYLVGGRW